MVPIFLRKRGHCYQIVLVLAPQRYGVVDFELSAMKAAKLFVYRRKGLYSGIRLFFRHGI